MNEPVFLLMALVVLVFAVLGSAWTWFLCRDARRADELLLNRLTGAYDEMVKACDHACATTASAAGVLKETINGLNDNMEKLAEVAITVHPAAAAERTENLLIQAMAAMRGNGQVEVPTPRRAVERMDDM
ncbi:MAG: hypothetical protein V1929_09110 [bacterium]